MSKWIKWYILFLVICNFTTSYGQGFSPYNSNSTYQKYLNYLIYSGKVKVDHPLSQPYSAEQLSDSLPKDISSHSSLPSAHSPHGWLSLLEYDLRKRYVTVGQADSLRGNLIIGLEAGDRNNYVKAGNKNYMPQIRRTA